MPVSAALSYHNHNMIKKLIQIQILNNNESLFLLVSRWSNWIIQVTWGNVQKLHIENNANGNYIVIVWKILTIYLTNIQQINK